MPEDRCAAIQRALEALEASPAPEAFEDLCKHHFITILLLLERQGIYIKEMLTRLSTLEDEVRALARRAEG